MTRNPVFLSLAVVSLVLASAGAVVAISHGVPAQVGGGDATGTDGASAGEDGEDGETSGATEGTTVTNDTEGNTTDLGTLDARIAGSSANVTAGASVSWVGDVDGDGQRDLVVGAPGNDTGGEDAGAASLFYGPVDPENVSVDEADATLVGESAGDEAGHAVASAGDLNDDGYDEVVVGAPLQGDSDAGAAYVIFGGEERLSGPIDLASTGVKLAGTSGDRAGRSVADGDGAAGAESVLVGAPRWDGDERDVGAAFLVTNETIERAIALTEEGPDLQATVPLADDADATLVGEGGLDQAGWAVDGAGDVNDDGTDDVVVGARKHNATDAGRNHTNAGAAYVLHGPVSGTVDLSASDRRLVGEATDDQAGYAVAGGSDLNGDGVDDVVVGAPFHNATSQNASNAGATYVVYGSADRSGDEDLASANVTLAGTDAGERAGWALATGNATCDATGDVLVGAPRDATGGERAGAAYLIAGGADLADATTLTTANRTLVGAGAGDEAGRAVSIAEVTNRTADGGPAVAVGAPFTDSAAGPDAGVTYVDYADCPAVQATNETRTGSETQTETQTQTQTETREESTTRSDAPAVPATDTETPVDTDTPTATEETAETASPTETETATPTQTPPDREYNSLEVEISCERETPFVFNDNDVAVTVTVAGPDGETTYDVGPSQDVGGPAAPSLDGESLPPGEYTVTATGPDGATVPVNGESEWTTTVQECPRTTLETQCVDEDTVQVSFRAENLDERFANPVAFEVQSPNPDDRREFTVQPDGDGVAATEFEIGDTDRATVWADLADSQPSQLASLTIEEGACDQLAASSMESDDVTTDERDGSAGTDTETASDQDDQEATSVTEDTETTTETEADATDG